jgi:phage gp29-like protein
MSEEQKSIVTPQRVQIALQNRFNPIRDLTPDRLTSHLDNFKTGRLRELALLMDFVEERDPSVKTVVAKRKKAVARLPWEIVTLETDDTARAERHREALEAFYNHLEVTDALNLNMRGGLSLAIRQMMDAQGKTLALHEVIWKPGKKSTGLRACLKFLPLCWFENRTGRLRYLETDYALEGRDLDPDGWLVSCGDGLMIPTAVAYLYKTFALRDWLVFCEKFGLPGVLGSTDAQPGTPQWTAMEDAVGSLINDWAAVKNKSDEIALLETKASGSTLPFLPLIEFMDRKIAALWRGADLSTISQGQEGAGASLQGDESDLLLEDDAAWVEETLADLSRRFIENQFGDEEPLAYLKLSTPKRRQVDADDKAIRLCLDAGIPLAVDATRERLGLPKPDADDEVLKAPPAGMPQDGPGAPEGVQIANEGFRGQLKAVKGQGVDFMQAAHSQFGRSLAADLAPLRRRLAAIEGISDPEIRKARLEALMADWESIASDITADPEAAGAVARIQGASLASGLAGEQADLVKDKPQT